MKNSVNLKQRKQNRPLLDSIVVSIPACHAGDRGSIPRRGVFLSLSFFSYLFIIVHANSSYYMNT